MIQRSPLVRLCAATIAMSLSTTMLGLFVPLLGLAFGLSPAGVGLVVSTAFLLPLALAVPAGRLVDAIGAKRVLIIGYGVFAAATVPVMVFDSLAALVVANVFATVGHLASVVGSQALVADLGTGKGRSSAYGWWTTSVSFGQLLGPLIAGVALDSLPRVAAFVPLFGFAVVALVLVRSVAPRGREDGHVFEAVLPRQASPLGAIRDPVVAMAILTSSAALWAMTVFSTFFPVHLSAADVSATTIGALMSLRALAAVLIRSVMSQTVDRLGGREPTVVVAVAALGVGLVVLGGSSTVWAYAVVCVVLGAASGLTQPVSMVMVADRVDARDRGSVLGVRLMGNRLAQLVSPVALVFLTSAGLSWLFAAHGALVLGVAALLAWGIRSLPNGPRSS